MIKEILNRFNKEAKYSWTLEELSGYFKGYLDMLLIMVSNKSMSQVSYVYIVHKITVKWAIIAYQKFNYHKYLDSVEKLHW